MTPLHICLLEPFFAGSHKKWAEGLKDHSRHTIDIISLPGRHWKWRMHGGAITLADRFRSLNRTYDALLATDMLDLSIFISLLRPEISNTPVAIYFHENQLVYPWSPRDQDPRKGRNAHYSFLNYSSALVADKLYFNSDYHRRAFLQALPSFLDRYPDFKNISTLSQIEAKSETLWLSLDLKAFDGVKSESKNSQRRRPCILWNHRWEYDKNPLGFFRILYQLIENGVDFDVALLGKVFREEPPYFKEARAKLGERIIHYGRAETFATYAALLQRADIALVTSHQDFFGGSVVEALYCGCHPVLPNRLAYPDHLDPKTHASHFYQEEDEAVEKLSDLIQSGKWRTRFPGADLMKRYDWSAQVDDYDQRLIELTKVKS